MNIHSICFVAPFAYPVLSGRDLGLSGGAEVHQVLCGRALRDAGYSVTFVVRDHGQEAREVHQGLEVLACPFRYLGGSNRYFPADTARLLALLRRIHADVHLMINPQSMLFALAMYRRFFGGRLVKIVGSTLDIRPASTLSSRLYRLGTKALDETVFQTAAQEEEGGRNLGLRGRVIPNFPPEVLEPPASTERDIDVLWVGGCDDNKRPELFLEMADALPDARCVLICSPRADAEQFEGIRQRSAAAPNVEHLDNVLFRDQSAPFYARARVLVMTSKHEGFPNVFLEAWQAGIPVVSLGVDPDDVIRRGGLGRVSATMEELVDDVRFFLDDEAARREAGARCREHMAATHSTDRLVGLFQELFDDL